MQMIAGNGDTIRVFSTDLPEERGDVVRPFRKIGEQCSLRSPHFKQCKSIKIELGLLETCCYVLYKS